MGRAGAVAFPLLLGACLLVPMGCRGAIPAAELVDVTRLDGSIRVEMRYAGPDNFVGSPIDGYEAPRCLLTRPAAQALVRVQARLRDSGLGLLVYDCYRPQRAVDHFVRWAADLSEQASKPRYYPRIDKSRLFELGYIAQRSGHSRGSTIDLTLVHDAGNPRGAPLDMGTDFDLFDRVSNTESHEVAPAQRESRLQLRATMEEGGFENYPKEWWHYTLREEPHPDSYWDVPVR